MNPERTDAPTARRYLIDRLARYIVTAGGLSVILSIFLILVFLFKETLPLWSRIRIEPPETLAQTPVQRHPVIGLSDDIDLSTPTYEGIAYAYVGEPSLQLFDIQTGKRIGTLALDALDGGQVRSVSRDATNTLAFGTASGRVITARAVFTVNYEGPQNKVQATLADVRTWEVAGDAIVQAQFRDGDEGPTLAALTESGRLIVIAERESGGFLSDEIERTRSELSIPPDTRITALALDSKGAQLFAGTEAGELLRWRIEDGTPEAVPVPGLPPLGRPITAMAFLLGDNTLLVGDRSGRISTYFDALQPDGKRRFIHVRDFRAHEQAITGLETSSREKLFVSAGADGRVAVHQFTVGRTIARRHVASGPIHAIAFSGRGDRLLVLDGEGQLASLAIDAPYAGVSMKTLFGKVWYENHPEPAYVWQSSAGSDAAEPKLSLIPLIFGTLKGTFYALLFAVPISIGCAIYTSQFMKESLRAAIKPVIELMAALPSVVIGFLAGLWLAPLLEHVIVPVLAVPLVAGVLFGGIAYLSYRLPSGVRRRFPTSIEMIAAIPLLLLGFWLSRIVGSAAEAGLFGGDFRLWVREALHLPFDQRNALVVGIAMGFAVIPLIYTISEDSLTRVPRSLRTASLALGATEWQTTWHVMLPSAAPGIFSAVMIGFGRAIGETMIMLMATGNTPIMSWNLFNGMRTLSANIAVELPEAPVGGTLYRVLFLTSVILFLGTFLVNTLAEIVRHRLRKQFGNV